MVALDRGSQEHTHLPYNESGMGPEQSILTMVLQDLKQQSPHFQAPIICDPKTEDSSFETWDILHAIYIHQPLPTFSEKLALKPLLIITQKP